MLVSGFMQIISETITRFDVCHLICRDAVESTERYATASDVCQKICVCIRERESESERGCICMCT